MIELISRSPDNRLPSTGDTMPTELKRIALLGALSATALTPVAALADENCTEAKAHFDIAREINTASAYEAHIEAFGSCPYAAFAEILAGQLAGSDAPSNEAIVAPVEEAIVVSEEEAAAALGLSTDERMPQDPAAQATALADGFVERFNSLIQQMPDPESAPVLSYDDARMDGEALVVEGLHWLDETGDGAEVARAVFSAPRLDADSSFRADSLALSEGRFRTVLQGEAEDARGDVLTFEGVEIGGLVLPPSGSSVLTGILPVSSVSIQGLAVFDHNGQVFSLRNLMAEIAGLSAAGDAGMRSVALRLGGLKVAAEQLAAGSEDFDLETMRQLGFEEIDLSFGAEGTLDPASGAASGTLSLSLADAGDLILDLELTEVNLDLFRALREMNILAVGNAPVALSRVSVAYADASLVDRVLPVVAASGGMSETVLRETLPSVVEAKLIELGVEADVSRAVAEGLRAFLENPQSVDLLLEPKDPLRLMDISYKLELRRGHVGLAEAFDATLSFNGAPGIRINALSLISVAACDDLAADSDDPLKPTHAVGVKSPDDIDWDAAIPACEAAHAAQPQDSRLAFQLGRAYQSAERFEDAARLYREASDAGHAVAQYELALAYLNGRGVQESLSKANRLLEMSSAAGNGYAAYELAVSKALGDGTEVDIPGAQALFEQAAEFGVSDALTELGKMHYRGDLGEPDFEAAYDYFRQAAEAGAAGGHFYVGFMKTHGWDGGTPESAAADMMRGLLLGDADAEAILVEEQGQTFELESRKAIQEFLRAEGYYSGPVDGVLGPEVQSAIIRWRVWSEMEEPQLQD